MVNWIELFEQMKVALDSWVSGQYFVTKHPYSSNLLGDDYSVYLKIWILTYVLYSAYSTILSDCVGYMSKYPTFGINWVGYLSTYSITHLTEKIYVQECMFITWERKSKIENT